MPPRNPQTKRPILLALDFADTHFVTRYQRNGEGHLVSLGVAKGAERNSEFGESEGRELLDHYRLTGKLDYVAPPKTAPRPAFYPEPEAA